MSYRVIRVCSHDSSPQTSAVPDDRPKIARTLRAAPSRPLHVEALEDRYALSVTSSFMDGVLTVNADSSGGEIKIYTEGDYIKINGADPAGSPLLASSIQHLVVNGSGSYDRIDLEAVDETHFTSLQSVLIDAGGSDDTIIGSQFGDVIYAGSGNDTVLGNGGDDIIYAGSGQDLVLGGAGNDQLYGEGGDDRIEGGDGNDIIDGGGGQDYLIGGNGDDTIYGGAGDDTILGDAGNDQLFGGDGNDVVEGGDGDDLLDGGDGNDQLFGQAGNDILYGGDGNDEMSGDAGDDQLYGGNDNDLMLGGDGNDYLDGGDGNDLMVGHEGNDTLVGGSGGDLLIGGYGDDTYLFYTDKGEIGDNLIAEAGGNDRVVISGANAQSVASSMSVLSVIRQIVSGGQSLTLSGQVESIVADSSVTAPVESSSGTTSTSGSSSSSGSSGSTGGTSSGSTETPVVIIPPVVEVPQGSQGNGDTVTNTPVTTPSPSSPSESTGGSVGSDIAGGVTSTIGDLLGGEQGRSVLDSVIGSDGQAAGGAGNSTGGAGQDSSSESSGYFDNVGIAALSATETARAHDRSDSGSAYAEWIRDVLSDSLDGTGLSLVLGGNSEMKLEGGAGRVELFFLPHQLFGDIKIVLYAQGAGDAELFSQGDNAAGSGVAPEWMAAMESLVPGEAPAAQSQWWNVLASAIGRAISPAASLDTQSGLVIKALADAMPSSSLVVPRLSRWLSSAVAGVVSDVAGNDSEGWSSTLMDAARSTRIKVVDQAVMPLPGISGDDGEVLKEEQRGSAAGQSAWWSSVWEWVAESQEFAPRNFDNPISLPNGLPENVTGEWPVAIDGMSPRDWQHRTELALADALGRPEVVAGEFSETVMESRPESQYLVQADGDSNLAMASSTVMGMVAVGSNRKRKMESSEPTDEEPQPASV